MIRLLGAGLLKRIAPAPGISGGGLGRENRERAITTLQSLAACILIISLAAGAFAADPPPTVESSLNRGFKFLVQQRNRDGSFGAENSRLLGTSRALLVFLQAGNVPDSGRYGTAVKEAEEWMVSSILPSGGFAGSDGRTRAQATAVLALAQAYGVESNPDRRARVLAALRLAVRPLLASQGATQNQPGPDAGGWGDEKNTPASLPQTAIAAAALYSARDVGVAVPDPALEAAKRYIASCRDGVSGGFGLQPGKPAGVDSTAAALMTLDILSPAGDDSDSSTATAYLEKQSAVPGKSLGFIGAAWVCWCDARLELPPVEKLRDTIVQQLMSTQEPDGGWSAGVAKPDATTPTRLSVTELALIGMTAHFRSTPILRH